jgi:hypothetical protein
MLMMMQMAAAQHKVDMRLQPPSTREEQLAGQKADVRPDRGSEPIPLSVRLRTISPINGFDVATVEALFQNKGKDIFRFPISRKNNLLADRNSSENRSLQCVVLARYKKQQERQVIVDHHRVGGDTFLVAFMSVNDPSSFIELRPKETIAVVFDAQLGNLFTEVLGVFPDKHIGPPVVMDWTPVLWRQYVKNGAVDAGLKCYHKRVEPNNVPSPKPWEEYVAHASKPFRSTNRVQLSMP